MICRSLIVKFSIDHFKSKNIIIAVFATAVIAIAGVIKFSFKDASLSNNLLYYATNGYLPGMQTALDEGAPVDARDQTPGYEGETPLMKAALNGDTATARFLLNQGADVNAQDERGETALLVAAYLGYLEMTQLLVESGADMNLASKDGSTPLLVAADQNRIEAVQYLLKQEAKEIALKSGYHILMASAKDSPEILKIFLERGADPNVSNAKGATALMEAACANNAESMKLLIEHGADLLQKDNKGNDILKYLFSCQSMYRYGFQYQLESLLVIMESEPQILEESDNKDLFHDFIREAAFEHETIDREAVKRVIKRIQPGLISSLDSEGYTALDHLYSRFGDSGNWLKDYLEERGAKGPHKELILKFNRLNKEIDPFEKNVSPENANKFKALIDQYGLPAVLPLIPSGFWPNAYHVMLTGLNVYPEILYSDSSYISYLCRSGHEDILLDYYDKNYQEWTEERGRYIDTDGDGLKLDFQSFAYSFFSSCSTKALEKMMEKDDPLLYKPYPVSYVMHRYRNSEDELKEDTEKVRLVLDYASRKPDAEIWKSLPLRIVRQHYDSKWLLLMFEYPLDANVTDNDGNNIVHLLLRRHAEKYSNHTPLSESDIALLEVLVSKGIDIDGQNKDGDTPLLMAARYGYYSVVKWLIENGAEIDEKNKRNENALFLATVNRHTSIVALLKELGARDHYELFFHDLHRQKNLSAALLKKYQLRSSKALDEFARLYGYTVSVSPGTLPGEEMGPNECMVYRAVEQRDEPRLKKYLEAGYYPDCLQVYSTENYSYIMGTALDEAIYDKNRGEVQMLLDYGADPEYIDQWGNSYFTGLEDQEIAAMLKQAIQKKKDSAREKESVK